MNALDTFPLLAELSDAERERLLDYLEEKTLEPERLLYTSGDESDFLVLIRSGRLRLEREGHGQGSLGKGETLGALSISVIGRRPLAARALEPCELFALDRSAYHRLRSDAPEIALALQEAILRDFAHSVAALLEPAEISPMAALDGTRPSD